MKNFKSNIVIALFIACSMNIYVLAAASKETESNTTIEISEACNENIKKINADGPELYWYLVGAFRAIAEKNDPEIKPSALFAFFAEHKTINSDRFLRFMTATEYIKRCILPLSDELDKEFEDQYKKINNVEKTWQWFEEYMKQKAIVEPLAIIKTQLIAADQEKRDLVKR